MAGATKPATVRGNPCFAISDFQKAQAARRWKNHVSKREAREIIKGLEELAVEELREQIAPLLGEPSPVEDWEPYPDPDEYDREPVTPFYTTKSETEAAARREARNKRTSLPK